MLSRAADARPGEDVVEVVEERVAPRLGQFVVGLNDCLTLPIFYG